MIRKLMDMVRRKSKRLHYDVHLVFGNEGGTRLYVSGTLQSDCSDINELCGTLNFYKPKIYINGIHYQ